MVFLKKKMERKKMGDENCPICGQSETVEKVGMEINGKEEFGIFKCLVCNEKFSKKIPNERNLWENTLQTTLEVF